MNYIKYFGIFIVFISSTVIGILFSKRYTNRVEDLKELKNALNMFEAKIKFTYKPIGEVFDDISNEVKVNIGMIFKKCSNYMKSEIAKSAWEKAVREEKVNTNLNNDDINVIMNLSKMLGNIDLQGQISNIELVINCINNQIDLAEKEKIKNEKIYKILGASVGLTIAIILI